MLKNHGLNIHIIIECAVIILFLSFLISNSRSYYNPTCPKLNIAFETEYRKDIDDCIINKIENMNPQKREYFLSSDHIIRIVEDARENDVYYEVTYKDSNIVSIEMQLRAFDDVSIFSNYLSLELGEISDIY